MIRRPPRSTRTDTLLPYTTLFRSRLFGVDGPHARGSDTGANAAEESRRIAAFDHAVQDCAGAFAGLVEQSAPLLGGGRADHRQLVERFEGDSRRQIGADG